MSLDLYLTSTGDIAFEETEIIKENGLTFNFFLAPSNALTFNFYTKSSRTILQNAQTLCIDFYTYTIDYDKNSRIVEENRFIQQAIKIRLSTEFGTMSKDEKFGSKIFELMHLNLDDSELLQRVEIAAREALSDLLPNAKITATKMKSNYMDYYDTIKLTIKHNNQVFYYTL